MGKFFVGQKPDDINLLSDDYTIVLWPNFKLHAEIFPYLVVRVFSGIYSPVRVPYFKVSSDTTRFSKFDANSLILITWAKDFARYYPFRCCVVVGPKLCYYVEPDGGIAERDKPPSGGNIINWQKFQSGEIKFMDTEDGGRVFYYQEGDNTLMAYSPGKPAKIGPNWLRLLRRLPRPITNFIIRFLGETGFI